MFKKRRKRNKRRLRAKSVVVEAELEPKSESDPFQERLHKKLDLNHINLIRMRPFLKIYLTYRNLGTLSDMRTP